MADQITMHKSTTCADLSRNLNEKVQLQAIFEQATSAIALTDLEGRFHLVNQPYSEIVGYSREKLLQLRIQDITHPDDLAHKLELFEQMLRDGANLSWKSAISAATALLPGSRTLSPPFAMTKVTYAKR